MSQVPAWRRPFHTLGFAFTTIGAILTMIGIIAINTPINCPAGGYICNPGFVITASLFPSGRTLVITGIVVIWKVKNEKEREDREPQ